MVNSRTPRKIGQFLRFFAMCLVYGVCLLLILRMCSAETPKAVKTLSPNEKLRALYEEVGGDMILCHQDQETITRAENCYGYFSVTDYVFIPEINQVQVVFRYNNSTLDHLMEDYSLAEPPLREGDYFDFTLVRTVDQMPENAEDNSSPDAILQVRYQPVSVEKFLTSKQYVYYRYVFDGVSLTEDTLGVFADVYYSGDLDYQKSPYGSLCLYDREDPWLYDRLTSADKKALDGGAP